MTGTITITYRRYGGDVEVSGSTFEIKDNLRSLGGRWDPERRLWTITADLVQLLRSVATAHGLRTVIEDKRRRSSTRPPTGRRESSWAAAMFAAVPSGLHDSIYRALQRVLHPDADGDLRASQQLNDAYADRQLS